jgi:hypothetical protein
MEKYKSIFKCSHDHGVNKTSVVSLKVNAVKHLLLQAYSYHVKLLLCQSTRCMSAWVKAPSFPDKGTVLRRDEVLCL